MQTQPQFTHSEGTSQADRMQPALDPGYVSVDERSVKDLLAFAQKYAQELIYFNEHNQPDGDWSRFLGEHDLTELAAYLKDPQPFQADPEKREAFRRPHLVLFLTFLELLGAARAQMNDLTRRHLEFYYREALRLTSQPGTPDQVHALVELADGQGQFLLPAGTLFLAGTDSQGANLTYRSDEDLLANQASVAGLKTVFAARQRIGFREARQNPDRLIELFPNNKDVIGEGQQSDRALMAMLDLALGSPTPGSPLIPYAPGQPVNSTLLARLDALLDFIPSHLYMPFSTFRSLMELKLAQANTAAQWNRVNDILEAVARVRSSQPEFKLDRREPANFEKNLLAALGLNAFGSLFNGLPEVDTIYDLYRQSARDDVQAFIPASLYKMPVADFLEMMKIVEDINDRWRQIYEILRTAARKIDPRLKLVPPQIRAYQADKFGDLIGKTLGKIDYTPLAALALASFDDCYRELLKLEAYFHLTAEEFVQIRVINAKQGAALPWEWQQLYAILQNASSDKAAEDRRAILKSTRETQGFQAMILLALGDPKPGDSLPEAKDFLALDPVLDLDYITKNLFLNAVNFRYIKDTQALGQAAPPEAWDLVYRILEPAQRKKRAWEGLPAEIEQWDNLYTAEDATQITVQSGAQGQPLTPRWKTFGQGYSDPAQAHTVPGRLGFAIASPLLALAEGDRVISLTLVFQEDHFDRATVGLAIQDPPPFQFLLSTAKGMLALQNVQLRLVDAPSHLPAGGVSQHALQVILTLDKQAPPIVPLAVGAPVLTPWPVLQILLADLPDAQHPDRTGPHKRYSAFQHLMLEKVQLKVTVDGITKLTLQNDNSLLDAKKPFEPFGMAPVLGSSFYFAHPELCSKPLDELRLNIDWFGVADDLSGYYLGYQDYANPRIAATSPIANNSSFQAHLRLYDNRSWFDVVDMALFHAYDPNTKQGAAKTNQVTISSSQIKTNYAGYAADLQPLIVPEVLDWRRYWQLELAGSDFLHAIYARAAAGCANKIDTTITTTPPTLAPVIINPPYTPKIKRLSLGYTASLEIDLTGADLNAQADRLYHLEPFGYRDLAGYDVRPFAFLPQFEDEGELLIGIQNLLPPQGLSLLFQIAEGSADPDVPHETPRWSYLDGNTWHSLEQGQLLSDTTNGLLNSGILKFDLAAVQPGTRLPAERYWLRAAIPQNSRGTGDCVAVKAQAVSATFVDNHNAPDHYAQPLPAASITGLADLRPQVKAIHQPFSSFGGKSPEQAAGFYTRASERLRHKNRALTAWDFEHMVLQAFSGIYKVKCLPVGVSQDPALADVIQIIVIPDIRGKLPFDPFEPKLAADMLFEIEQYLSSQCAPFARFQVKNPTYVRLQVRLGVRLRQDANAGYYQSRLNDELQQYLAPWAYDRSAEIVFGGAINTGLIVNFVEERPYVDYVAGIRLFIIPDGQKISPYDGALLAPDAILVSDRVHQIDLISAEGFVDEYFTGINYMKIELDFQVGAG